MDANALRQERLELFDNAYGFKANKRVPSLGTVSNWMFHDAGLSVSEALHDYDMNEAATRRFHGLYQFDSYLDFGTRFATRVSDAFGARFHYVDETDEFVIANDRCILEVDEYAELIEDRVRFYWSKGFQRYCKPGLTIGEFRNAMLEYMAFNEFRGRMSALMDEVGIAPLPFQANVGMPFETVFNYLRGIKGTASDVRRNKGALKELCDALWEEDGAPALANAMKMDTSGCVADLFIAFLGHSILSASQFEEFFWPYVKQVVDSAVANNKKLFLLCEAEMLRFAEFFEDIPKGTLMVLIEQDDIFEYRKRFPNIAVIGGMKTQLLGYGSPQECIDYAKHLIDTLGEGYVFSTNKFLAFRDDATRENLTATCDFVRGYQP